MKEFLESIKNKIFPKPDLDFEDEDDGDESEIIDDIEVESQDPEQVAKAKKKNMIVIFVALVLTFVVYFIFFSKEEVKEDLVKAEGFVGGVAGSGGSPFKIDIEDPRVEEDFAVLDSPTVPELPEMPEVSDDKNDSKLQGLFSDDIFEEEKKEPVKSKKSKEDGGFEVLVEEGGVNEIVNQAPKIKEKKSVDLEEGVKNVEEMERGFKDPRYAPIIVVKGGDGSDIPGAGQDNNLKILNKDPVIDIDNSQVLVQPSFIKNRENVVGQGKIISAVLETAIDTEMPGAVRAIVSRDVYGEVGNKVLISKGSRLYGEYSREVFRGQSRVDIKWTRLLRPDGISVAINSIASDQFGRAGIQGGIDNKFGENFANTVLSSVLAIAGVALTDELTGSQQSTTSTNAANGTATVTQSAINQAVSDIASNITKSAQNSVSGFFDTRPRVTVPQGTRVTILVNADIKVPTFNSK